MSQDDPVDRRRFFRQGLRELLRPLASAIEPIERAAHHLASMDADSASPLSRPGPGVKAWLRPPGSIAEEQFLQTCSRGGECVRVCPAQCIKIDPAGSKGGGAPYIEVDAMPCVVCTGLHCMHVCPSGALVPTPLMEIDMGLAVWNEETCVRSRGEQCTICIDHCPIGTVAIELVQGKVHVIESGCIGCGVCQHDCPTQPKSIVVIPKTEL